MALSKLRTEKVTVTTAGTAVVLSATPKLVQSLNIYAHESNSNRIYVGDSTVSSTDGHRLGVEDNLEIECPTDASGHNMEIDLNQIYVDADTNGNAVIITYLERS